jgi:hypothetical protein
VAAIQLKQKFFFAIESRFKNQRIYERRRHGVFSPFIFWNAFLKTETPTDSQPLSREERFLFQRQLVSTRGLSGKISFCDVIERFFSRSGAGGI